MPENNNQEKAIVPQNADYPPVPKDFLALFDKMNTEAKIRAEVEQKSLEMQDKDNERHFKIEEKRIDQQSELIHKNMDIQKVRSWLFAGAFVVIFGSLIYFAYLDKMDILEKIYLPLCTAAIGLMGGYGYGFKKGYEKASLIE